jgi:hypothetical protein
MSLTRATSRANSQTEDTVGADHGPSRDLIPLRASRSGAETISAGVLVRGTVAPVAAKGDCASHAEYEHSGARRDPESIS